MAAALADRQCVPCRGGVPPLTAGQIAPLLAQLEGWQVEDGKKLSKAYKVRNFVRAVEFVDSIAPLAEEQGHHPDLHVRWGEVRVELWTHAIGGLSESDFIMAAKIDRLFAERKQARPAARAAG